MPEKKHQKLTDDIDMGEQLLAVNLDLDRFGLL